MPFGLFVLDDTTAPVWMEAGKSADLVGPHYKTATAEWRFDISVSLRRGEPPSNNECSEALLGPSHRHLWLENRCLAVSVDRAILMWGPNHIVVQPLDRFGTTDSEGFMNRLVVLMRVLGLSLAVGASSWAAEANPEQTKAIAEIEKLGGQVTLDEKSPDKAVIGVDLTKTKVTDAELVHFKGLTNLQRLVLSNTKVTGVGLQHLKGLTRLETLNLTGSEATDAGLEYLKGLTNLQQIFLSLTKVTDTGLKHLKELANLRVLCLYSTEVTDGGLEHLKGLTKLQTLDLTNTKVTGAGLKYLKGLTKLQWLDLAATEMTDAGLEYLKGLTNLQRLYQRWPHLSRPQITNS